MCRVCRVPPAELAELAEAARAAATRKLARTEARDAGMAVRLACAVLGEGLTVTPAVAFELALALPRARVPGWRLAAAARPAPAQARAA